MTSPSVGTPVGIKGWLLFFLIVQAALCLWTLSTITDALNGFVALTDDSLPSGALYRPLVFLESFSHLVQALVPIGGFYLVYKRSRWAPTYWIVFLIFIAIYAVLDMSGGYVLAAKTSGAAGAPQLTTDLSGSMSLEALTTLRMAAWAIVWAVYWGRSARVRNTFGVRAPS